MMSYEKQNSFADGRHLVRLTDSPQRYGKRSSLPKAAASPVTHIVQESGNGGARVSRNGPEFTRENVATPVKSFLSSNITPRSGSRKARAESASPTPNGTSKNNPTPSRLVSSIEKRQRSEDSTQAVNGLAITVPILGRSSRTESVTSDGPGSSFAFRPPLVERSNSRTSLTSLDTTPMFFYANEVQATKNSRPKSVNGTSETWVAGYANARVENIPSGRSSAMNNNSPVPDEQRSKLFCPTDTHDTKSPSPRTSSIVPSSRPTLQTIYSEYTTVATTPVRPTSPLKEEILPRKSSITKASPRRHTRLVSNGGTEIKSPDTAAYGSSTPSRRSSLNSPANPSISTRIRSSSLQSSPRSPPRRSSISILDASPERTRTTSAMSNTSMPNHDSRSPSTAFDQPTSPLRMQPQSPTKPQSKLDQMNELAANARRERKVLDLEISNSSLLAINRTLEREMRKQSAELRNYRRLSRSGRLSIAPSSRSASGRKSTLSEADTNIDSDDLLSASDSEQEDNGDFYNVLSSASSKSTRSPPLSPLTRAARHRFKDPKTLSLDFTAQRAILFESQRLNQSIKRCLGHTESLIASSKQALDYEYHIPQTENLGPKVLTPDETEDNVFYRRQGLLSPSILSHDIMNNPWECNLNQAAKPDVELVSPDSIQQHPPADGVHDLQRRNAADAEVEENSEKTENETRKLMPNDVTGNNPTDQAESLESSIQEEISAIQDSLPEAEDTSMPPPELPSASYSIDEANTETAKADTADSAMRTPGNRSSMQNIGHYLQSFGIFGAGGIRPP